MLVLEWITRVVSVAAGAFLGTFVGRTTEPVLLPVDEDAEKKLKRRTLTNLYNQRPAWLADLHDALDAAVYEAYGWSEVPGELGWRGCSR